MLYFLSNSLAVVGAAGVLFFVLGLWFGFLTWGRYKRRSRAFQEETSLLRHEIATLKRRIAEEAVEPSLPVSINDEGPSVGLQPLLFGLGAAAGGDGADTMPTPLPPRVSAPAPAPVEAPGPSVTSSIIANAKATVAVPASLPDSVGSEPEVPRATPPVPKPELVMKPHAVEPPPVPPPAAPPRPVAISPALLAPQPPPPPALTPIVAETPQSPPPPEPSPELVPVVKGEKEKASDGPVVSLATPGRGLPSQLLPDMIATARTDAPSTSQMSASLQISHDAGPLDLPTLPSFESLATTLSSSSSIVVPVPMPPVAQAPLVSEPPPVPLAEVSSPPPVPARPPATESRVMEPAPVAVPVPPAPAQGFASELEKCLGLLDPQIGFCYTQRPERWDDLTLLRGLGEGLQQHLHDSGIYTFKQIALWTEAQAAEIGQRLNSRERIQRDRWVQQARDMHYLKYGERLGS